MTEQNNQNDIINCDIAIVGGGSGGLSLAAGASQMGANVVLVEGDKMGGDCLNHGCVPSKSLLAAAKRYREIGKPDRAFGLKTSSQGADIAEVLEHVHEVISTIADHDSIERFENMGVQVIQAKGWFLDQKTLQAGEYKIKAKRFVIATGSSPLIPPIEGLEQVPYLTNETIFDLKQTPKHLIVIGGGPIGSELAQAFAMLGIQVTLLEGVRMLPKDEPDCGDIVKQQMIKDGVAIYEGFQVDKADKKDSSITITGTYNNESVTIEGSHLLIATGRRPNIQDLNLDKAGVNYERPGIKVDKRLRSSNRHVYAIGDASGHMQFTHMASYQASIALRNILFRWPVKVNYKAVPWVTYTEPELAHVGLTLEDAHAKSLPIKVTEWPFGDNDRAQAERRTQGKIKIITDKKAKILGATIVGHNAGELILPWIIAINEGKTLRSFTDAIAPYPTLSEISKRAAGQFYTPTLFSHKMRTLVRWLLKLG